MASARGHAIEEFVMCFAPSGGAGLVKKTTSDSKKLQKIADLLGVDGSGFKTVKVEFSGEGGSKGGGAGKAGAGKGGGSSTGAKKR
jgi:hypothetical protein